MFVGGQQPGQKTHAPSNVLTTHFTVKGKHALGTAGEDNMGGEGNIRGEGNMGEEGNMVGKESTKTDTLEKPHSLKHPNLSENTLL